MTRSTTLATRSALTLSLATLLATSPAAAGTVIPAPSPAPAPAPSGSVAGPPDGMIAPPPPQSGSRPFPTIGTFPTPAPSPSVRPSQPQPPQATPTPSQAPAQRPAQSRPPAAAPVAEAEAAPANTAAAEPQRPPAIPSPIEPVGDAPSIQPPESAPASGENQWPEWLPLAALGGVAALAGGGWLAWRRRRKALALPAPTAERAAPPTPPTPKPQAQQTPRPAPVPAPTALGRRADLDIAFEPLSAQSTLMNLRIRYAIIVRNTGQIAAEPVVVRIGLFAGSQVHSQGIAQWFGLADQQPHHGVQSIPAGSDYRFEGELAAPLDALNPMTIDGRVLAIPLVAIDARYGHGEGEAPIEGQSARAFVIGRDPQREGAKLAPFRLDQGPTSFAPLGQRDTGISKVA